MRSRNIKPGFFKNDLLAECDPLARILFTGLWCLADREGRVEYRAKKIKAELLPYDNCNVDKLLTQLSDKNFITIYTVNNENYIEITAFLKHQTPHIKEQASTIPAPDKNQTGTSLKHLIPDSLILIPDSITDIPDKSGAAPIPFQEIIEYLNLKTGKNFNHQSKETRAKIKARWGNNGTSRTLEDFITVIDNKCTQWLNDEKMLSFLRPETLFGPKFESYLNEQIPSRKESWEL
jgi:uncharacterized phage protein (TIGR02220 family)